MGLPRLPKGGEGTGVGAKQTNLYLWSIAFTIKAQIAITVQRFFSCNWFYRQLPAKLCSMARLAMEQQNS